MITRTVVRTLLAFALLFLCIGDVVVADEEVVAAVPRDFPPLYHLDSEGRPSGSAIEVMEQVAKYARVRVRYIVKPDWESTMEALRRGEAEIIPNLGVTPDRMVDFDFTNPLETLSLGIFVRSEAKGIEGMDDLDGVKTAVVKGNAAVAWLKSYPKVKPVEFQNQEQALFALLSGEVDALIYPTTVIWRMASAIGVQGDIRQPGGTLVEIKRAMAVRKGNNSLLQRLDEAVREYTRSEQFGTDYARLHSTPSQIRKTDRVLWYGIGSLAVLLCAFVALHLRRVAQLQRELARCRATLARNAGHAKSEPDSR
jgi:ABC-type amino acid transport substrate-binding protein